jgi:hypothetical protein
MTLASLLVLAADSGQNTQEAPDTGLSAALAIGVLLGIVLMAVILFTIFHRSTKASKGGVEPKPGEFERGDPPFESVGRKADQSPG